jgi:hypothetical protein
MDRGAKGGSWPLGDNYIPRRQNFTPGVTFRPYGRNWKTSSVVGSLLLTSETPDTNNVNHLWTNFLVVHSFVHICTFRCYVRLTRYFGWPMPFHIVEQSSTKERTHQPPQKMETIATYAQPPARPPAPLHARDNIVLQLEVGRAWFFCARVGLGLKASGLVFLGF